MACDSNNPPENTPLKTNMSPKKGTISIGHIWIFRATNRSLLGGVFKRPSQKERLLTSNASTFRRYKNAANIFLARWKYRQNILIQGGFFGDPTEFLGRGIETWKMVESLYHLWSHRFPPLVLVIRWLFQEARAREPQLSTNFCDKGIKSQPGKSGGKQQLGGYTLPENEQLAAGRP